MLASEKILSALSAAGFPVRRLDELHLKFDDYSGAIPTLIVELHKGYPEEYKMVMASLLISKHSLLFRGFLVKSSYEKYTCSDDVRYIFACAIAATTTKANLEETVAVLRDRTLGEVRLGLLGAISRRRSQPGIPELIKELAMDTDLAREIGRWR